MKGKTISDALGEINENYVRESAPKQRKSVKKRLIAAVAAVLAVAIAAGAILRGGTPRRVSPVPGSLKAYALSAPVYPEGVPYPATEFGREEWAAARNAQMQYRGAGRGLAPFMDRLAAVLFGSRTENTVYSPVSVFLAAAMLAELTGGSTRQQLLDALDADSIEALRKTAHDVWNANYTNDGATTSILGSSVWMSSDFDYKKEATEALAQYYYAASFAGSFAKKQYVDAMAAWVNAQTGNLLADAVKGMELPPAAVFTLLSTVLFRAKWKETFQSSKTAPGTFYAPQGEETVDFMHSETEHGRYYWGAHFGAVELPFKEGGSMWFFLPDEGYTPADLYTDPEALELMDMAGDWQAVSDWKKQKYLKIRLSLPKFDVASDLDLSDALSALGITECFGENADFSPLTENGGIYVSGVKHAARVAVDEEGVTATAFTAVIGAGDAMPPEEEIDFVLDRPFAFVLAGTDTLPLFEGAVWSIAG